MSSLKDLASLIMIPSLYEDGELHTVKPLADENIIVHPDATDNNDGVDGSTPSTSSNFTFSRGSNLAATRVDVNGLIEKGRENLLTYSNTFDNAAWEKFRVNVTSGQSGYDGSNDAWLLTATDTFSARVQQTESLTGVQALSVYAKAATANFIVSEKAGTNGFYVWFDLANGTIGNTSGDIDATIEDVGGGWYRCSISGNPSAASKSQFYIAETNGSTTISVGASIYIQDAQLEAGLVATDYIETGATSVSAGILEDMPRLDYSGGASCPALLLEPQRTNLIPHSEYFADSSYIDNGVSFTLGFLSPDGNLNASKLLEDNTNSIHRFYQTSLVTASPNATISVYVKYNGRRFVLMRIADSGVGRWYDIENGVLGGNFQGTPNDSTIEPVGNDWYRITISHSVSSVARFEFWVSDTESTSAYQGDVTKGAYIYGAQLEAGSYPTSYIPTYGASVTRSKDSCENTSAANLIGQTEGVVFVEFDKKNGTGERRFFLQIGSGSTTIYARLESNNSLTTQILNSGTDYLTSTGTIIPSGNNKFAVAYANNDAVFYLNGTQLASSSSVVVPELSDLYIGSNSSNSQTIAGEIKQTLLFKTRLTNAELAALTTI